MEYFVINNFSPSASAVIITLYIKNQLLSLMHLKWHLLQVKVHPNSSGGSLIVSAIVMLNPKMNHPCEKITKC